MPWPFFSGDATVNLHLHVNTTAFRVQVYEALIKISPAKLRTYTETARFIGRPRAVRAVGNAVASNPISLIIPCHRIVPASADSGTTSGAQNAKWPCLVGKPLPKTVILQLRFRKPPPKTHLYEKNIRNYTVDRSGYCHRCTGPDRIGIVVRTA